MSHMGGA